MTLDQAQHRRSLIRGALSIIGALALYEAVAYSGYFPQVLLPTVQSVAETLVAMLADGVMFEHAGATLYRVLFGFCLALALGIPLGIAMARFKPVENFFLPLVSALMPIPSFALVPLFMLWFGIGNTTTILIVFYAATFPILFNTWSGVRSVNPLWLRAAGAMGADEKKLFWKVIIPGASPFIITGMRQAIPAFVDRGGGRGDDRGLRLGPGLGDLRRQGVPAGRHHAGRDRGDRGDRLRVRAAGVRLDRKGHRAEMGHGADSEGVSRS